MLTKMFNDDVPIEDISTAMNRSVTSLQDRLGFLGAMQGSFDGHQACYSCRKILPHQDFYEGQSSTTFTSYKSCVKIVNEVKGEQQAWLEWLNSQRVFRLKVLRTIPLKECSRRGQHCAGVGASRKTRKTQRKCRRYSHLWSMHIHDANKTVSNAYIASVH